MKLHIFFKAACILLFLGSAKLFCNTSNINNIIGNKNLSIWGMVSLRSNKVLIIRDKSTKDSQAYFLVYQGDTLINYKKIEHTNIYSLKRFYFSERYFVIYTLDSFLIYDEKKNIFTVLHEENGHVGNVILYKDSLYYSTEKTKECVRKINLDTKKVTGYTTSFANTPFFIINEKLYVRDYYTKEAYLIGKNSIIKANFKIDEKMKDKLTFDDIKTKDIKKYANLLHIEIYE